MVVSDRLLDRYRMRLSISRLVNASNGMDDEPAMATAIAIAIAIRLTKLISSHLMSQSHPLLVTELD